MKLNKIFLFAATILGTALTACSSDDDITVGEQDTAKPFVYFSSENKTTYSVEPTAPTEFSIKFGRQDASNAVDIPLEVTENTDNVFNVPSTVSFAAGETESVITVTYPDAPIGKPCTLRVGLSPDYAGIYKDGTREMVFTVNRVKWNSLGMGTMDENFYFEEKGMKYEILQRDDKPTVFRLMYPFSVFSNTKDNASEYIEMTILQPKDKVNAAEITMKDLVHFTSTNTGYFHPSYSAYVWMHHPSAFSSLCKEENFLHNKVISYQEDGKTPGQIQLAPYYYMDGVGGWNQTQEDDVVIITFPGFVPKYTANIETDFEYDEVFEGQFTSGLLGKNSTASLYVGTCVETKDDCDKVFEETYGKIYKIASPYAEDYNLTFLVKKGTISLPEGEDYELQATGLQALGKDVYAKINAGASKFEEDKVTLNITFTDAEGEVDYGTFDEVLENIKWESLGTGSYTDAFIGPLFGLPAVTYDVEIMTCDKMPGIYRLMNPYSNSVYPYAEGDCAPDGLYLDIDASDPDGVLLEEQALGFNWGYGEFSIISIGAYFKAYQGIDKATLKKAGYLGTLKDGVITLPVPADQGVAGLILMGGKAYNGDVNGEFKVVLPSARQEAAKPVVASTGNKALVNSWFKNTVPAKTTFTVRKDGRAPSVKTTKDSAPVMAPKF